MKRTARKTSLIFYFIITTTILVRAGLIYPTLRLIPQADRTSIKGCYHHTDRQRICFYIHNDYMYIREPDGKDLALYVRYSNDTHYVQVLGHGILRHNEREVIVQWKRSLNSFARLRLMIKRLAKTQQRDLRAKRAAKGNFVSSKITRHQMLLLVKMSESLGRDAGTRENPAVQHFHLLVMGVVRSAGHTNRVSDNFLPDGNKDAFKLGKSNVEKIAAETWTTPNDRNGIRQSREKRENQNNDNLRQCPAGNNPLIENHTNARETKAAAPASKSDPKGPRPTRTLRRPTKTHTPKLGYYGSQVGCADLRKKGHKCFGMCGTRCWCWPWICGDCCRHKGCIQHDWCCRNGYWSLFCLCPWCFGFDCNIGYRGFPKCL